MTSVRWQALVVFRGTGSRLHKNQTILVTIYEKTDLGLNLIPRVGINQSNLVYCMLGALGQVAFSMLIAVPLGNGRPPMCRQARIITASKQNLVKGPCDGLGSRRSLKVKKPRIVVSSILWWNLLKSLFYPLDEYTLH